MRRGLLHRFRLERGYRIAALGAEAGSGSELGAAAATEVGWLAHGDLCWKKNIGRG